LWSVGLSSSWHETIITPVFGKVNFCFCPTLIA
jgi:hypothetical protein